VGSDDNDIKNGKKSIRIKDGGKLTSNFDINLSSISISYGAYDASKATSFELWVSADAGKTWKKAGVVSKLQGKLETAKFNVTGKYRIEIRNTSNSGARINIDDLTWNGTTVANNQTDNSQNQTKPNTNPIPTPAPTNVKDNDHLLLGNPSNAQTNESMPDNYLLTRKQYALSYNRSRGGSNWVAWHLNKDWKGDAERTKDFHPDTSLPSGWYQVATKDYSNSGFDRGHMCPSDDRDKNAEDNLATFMTTNIIPQAPKNNQETWRLLEEYCRRLVTDQNKELYIICGSYGKGGINKDNEKKNEIAGGKITVPARVWKIVVILDNANGDLQRINANTRIIAIDTPNVQNVSDKPLGTYRVSVRDIEKATGYNFFSNLPQALQDQLETMVDKGEVH
jgi:endonuclease G